MRDMRKPVVFLFSGQGSQYYHMAKELYRTDEAFRRTMQRLDRIATERLGESVLEQLYAEGKGMRDSFAATRFTHPAIFMVEYALAESLREKGVVPDVVLGTSLGEYAAAAVAGVAEPEALLRLLIRQARLLETLTEEGHMMAILHSPDLYKQMPELREGSEIAGINYGTHFVVSGSTANLQRIEGRLKEREVMYQMLPVSHAFHAAGIDPVAGPFLEALRELPLKRPGVRMVSALTGQLAIDVPQEYLWRVVRDPIRFPEAIETVRREFGDCLYLDLGPSGTLATFLRQLAGTGTTAMPVITPFHQELKNIEGVLAAYRHNQQLQAERKVENMKAYVFPGQGAQTKGMGAELFDEFPAFTAQADEILGYSIKELCVEDPREELGQTQFTQPALYVVNALSYLKKVQEDGRPDYVAGHSLGEYNALFAAGAFDFATGLKLVQKRGELMSKAFGGGMAAVIGMKEERIEEILRENGLTEIQIANYNSPAQIVVAGPKDDILRAQPFFEEARMYVPLKVSGAFHSKFMADAKGEFEQFLNGFALGELTIPVISNVHARPYKQRDLKKNLVEQITHSVKWTETVRYLMGVGEIKIEEVGPGRVLTGLVGAIRREAEPLNLAEIELEESRMEAAVAAAVEEAQAEASEAVGVADSVEAANAVIAEETPAAEAAAEADAETAQTTQAVQETVQEQAVEAPAAQADEPIVAASVETSAAPATAQAARFLAERLGNAEFRADYKLRYAYAAGSMHRGIASKELVVKMARAGMLAFLGTNGLPSDRIAAELAFLKKELNRGEAYGVNVSYSMSQPETEEATLELCRRHDVPLVEASGYLSMTPALVKYRLSGLKREGDGTVSITRRILAKASRPEVAEMFLSPAPERLLKKLLDERQITEADADLLRRVPMADDLCAEADSGGQTDQANAYALLPAILKQRDELMAQFGYAKRVRVGAAGGIGTPEAAAAAFVMGADFILTGSINQCTVEAGTSPAVKDMLQEMNVQDTDYAPAEGMFELGSRVQVLKKGLFFAARANKLYDLYRHFNAWSEIDEKSKTQLQTKYFKRSFEQVFDEVRKTFPAAEIDKAERNPKHKLALVFRWYLRHATDAALSGRAESKVDYQIYCGPALGAFNQWVKGTPLQSWQNRRVDRIGEHLMAETAALLNNRLFQ